MCLIKNMEFILSEKIGQMSLMNKIMKETFAQIMKRVKKLLKEFIL